MVDLEKPQAAKPLVHPATTTQKKKKKKGPMITVTAKPLSEYPADRPGNAVMTGSESSRQGSPVIRLPPNPSVEDVSLNLTPISKMDTDPASAPSHSDLKGLDLN